MVLMLIQSNKYLIEVHFLYLYINNNSAILWFRI